MVWSFTCELAICFESMSNSLTDDILQLGLDSSLLKFIICFGGVVMFISLASFKQFLLNESSGFSNAHSSIRNRFIGENRNDCELFGACEDELGKLAGWECLAKDLAVCGSCVENMFLVSEVPLVFCRRSENDEIDLMPAVGPENDLHGDFLLGEP